MTIDPDTEVLLKEEVRLTGQPFKKVLNQAIRKGLGRVEAKDLRVTPLFRESFPPEFIGVSMNRLTDELDDQETMRELGA